MALSDIFGEGGAAMPLGLALMRMGGRSDKPRNLGVELGAAMEQQQKMQQAKQQQMYQQLQMEKIKAAILKEKKMEGLSDQLAALPPQFVKAAVPGTPERTQFETPLMIQGMGGEIPQLPSITGSLAGIMGSQPPQKAPNLTSQTIPGTPGQPASMDYEGLQVASLPIRSQIDPVGTYKELADKYGPKAPIKVGAEETLIDPRTFKNVYQGPGKEAYKDRTNVKNIGGVPHYVKEFSSDNGKTWKPLSDPYPIKSTVASNNNNVTIAQEKEFEKELGKGQAKALLESRQSADDAVQIINTVSEGKKLLNKGMVTGIGADYIVGFGQALKQAGLTNGSDAVANTQAYTANMAQNVGKIIKQFGAGTGLSDADRDYAAAMAGGKINIDEKAIRKILDINDRGARNILKLHNKRAAGIKTNIPLTVDEPQSSANDGWSMKPLP